MSSLLAAPKGRRLHHDDLRCATYSFKRLCSFDASQLRELLKVLSFRCTLCRGSFILRSGQLAQTWRHSLCGTVVRGQLTVKQPSPRFAADVVCDVAEGALIACQWRLRPRALKEMRAGHQILSHGSLRCVTYSFK